MDAEQLNHPQTKKSGPSFIERVEHIKKAGVPMNEDASR